MKPALQDFDRVHTGKITKPQFRSVLRSFGLPLSDAESAALAEAYEDERGDVQYYWFLREADPLET